MEDADAFSVAERDAALTGIDAGMQVFLDRQTETALKNEKGMKIALQAELERLCAQSVPGIQLSPGTVDYYWEGESM